MEFSLLYQVSLSFMDLLIPCLCYSLFIVQLQEEYVAYGLSTVFGNYYPEEEGYLRFLSVAV